MIRFLFRIKNENKCFLINKKVTNRITNRKGAIAWDMIGWLLLGLAVLVVVIIAIIYLSGNGSDAINYVKDLFRFGGKS